MTFCEILAVNQKYPERRIRMFDEPSVKIYIPRPSDTERLNALAQSDAPVKIYTPAK